MYIVYNHFQILTLETPELVHHDKANGCIKDACSVMKDDESSLFYTF